MHKDPIAIVGAAGRFPGADSLDKFWNLLAAGRDAVTEIPDGRWSKDFYYHPDPAERGKAYTFAAGVIDNIDQFDAGFFGISPREADQIDPQQRLLLELTWRALEDAGIPASRVAGSGCGVYIGASSGDYGDMRMGDPSSGDAYFMTGVTASILANRLSYIYDLHGPSFTVDTACSSSLVALDQACQAIQDKRVPMAIVGGVSLLLSPYPFIGFCRASMLSPSGRCFAFDARANGYVRAEGGGLILLKPLNAALADGDNIRGVILGTGVNSDGRTTGLSLPNGAAQARLLKTVYDTAGIAPDMLSFVEAHGTGTQAGDPIEVGAIGRELAQRRAAPLPIGSVKTNIGHLEAASGMAGLLKALLALENRLLPQSLHFETPNPNIPFDELNIAVAGQPMPLAKGDGRLIAGVNSFGFGGTNGHAILASAPKRKSAPEEAGAAIPPLLISARSEASLKELANAWSHALSDAPDDASAVRLIRGGARHRDQEKHRIVVVGETPIDIADKLDAFAATGRAASLAVGTALPTGKLAFIFSGNGVQKPGMARDAMMHSTVFRETLAELDETLKPLLGWSVSERLMANEDPAILARTDVAQPMLFAIQVGVTAALRAQGIEPAAFAGHSVGEIAAGWASGALSLAAACKIIVVRSEQQQRTQGAGGMAALQLPADQAREVLVKLGGGLEIAAINSSSTVTVAGPNAALPRLEEAAKRNQWRFTRLGLDYAFHSAVLDPIRDDLIAALGDTHGIKSGERFVSTVTGAPLDGRKLDAEYWWRNIRDPVQFKPAIDHMIADGVRIFVEIGPNPALLSHIRDGLKIADVTGRVFGSLTHAGADRDPFPAIAAEAHVAGHSIARARVFDGATDFRALPAYPWQKERHWFTPTEEGIFLDVPRRDHPLLGFQRNPPNRVWSNFLTTDKLPWLLDHVIESMPVVPGAGLVEIALAAARVTYPDAQCLEVTGVEIPRALVVEPGHSRELRVRLQDGGQLEIASRARLGEEPWSVNAVARIAKGSAYVPELAETGTASRTIGAAALYAAASTLGLNYGPKFRVVRQVDIVSGNEAVIALDTAAGVAIGDEFVLNPALFDGVLQGFLALLAEKVEIAPGESFIPSRFGRVRVFAPYGRAPASAKLSIRHAGVRAISASISLFDGNGDRIGDVDECWFQRVRLNRQSELASQIFRFDRIAAPGAWDQGSPTIDLAGKIAKSAAPAKDYRETRLLFDAYLASSAYAAVKPLVHSGAPVRIDDLASSGAIARDAAPLLGWLMLLMERHGIATDSGQGWILSDEAALPDADVIWRTLIDDAPELTAELALTGGADLPQLLRNGLDGTVPSGALVDQMLYGSPSGEQALADLSQTVLNIAQSWPKGRPLRLIEVGAGSGTLTRRLLGRLGAWQGTLIYEATDSDPHMVQRLKAITDAYRGASASEWNPRNGALNVDERFDLIVSLYGISRLDLDENGANRMLDVLAPGGYLLAAEPEQSDVWNAIFGQGASWWQGSLTSDFPTSPIRGGTGLADLLTGAGFAGASSTAIGEGLWSVTLLTAQRQSSERDGEIAGSLSAGSQVVLIAVGGDKAAAALAKRLSDAGIANTTINPPEVADGAELCAALGQAGSETSHVVCLPPPPAELSADSATARMVAVLTVARLVAETAEKGRLWIVTRGAQADVPAPGEAALWGLGRTICNEQSQLDCRLVDLPRAWGAARIADILAHEIATQDDEREIVWSDIGRQAMRLERGLPQPLTMAPSTKLVIERPGLLDTLGWRPVEAENPGPGQVQIEVHAAGLNFRDVMWAMALLPEEALMGGFSGPTLGLECTGVVSAVGAGVQGVAIGDRVMALAPAALRSHVVTEAHAVAPLPEALSFAAGATIPVTYLTVLYSLKTQARLEAGETILIHGGAGGVGLAAIQYARHCGATIIATAGSPTKRAFLRHLGVDHVLDSRDIAFADAVRDLTGGHGVDVVLNSLGGEAMERSLGLLKPFGRFVELGKRDFMMDTHVGLRALRQNISYYAVDVDRLPIERPDLAAKLLREVTELMAAGDLRPLPCRTFPFAEAADAFRLMQVAGHLGKIVLVPDDRFVPTEIQPAERIRSDRTYVITGGLTGFGLETARWLAAKGARHLALLSRSGKSAEADAALPALTAAGVDARAFACDVTHAAALAKTLADIRKGMAPIGGVIHAAMIVDDGLVGNLTHDRIESVMAPKLNGALHLDRLTRNDPIELFLLYSSATTVMGAPGQGSYVAANMALEAIARARKAEGLPALAVAWGPIGDVGYLARQDAARDALMRRLATAPMTAREALDYLPVLLGSGEPVVAFAPVRWDAAHQFLPILKNATFEDVAAGGIEIGVVDIRDRIHSLPPDEAKDFIVGLLIEEAARVMSFAPDRIDPQRPLSEFGMDSLMAVELRLALETRLGIDVPLVSLSDNTSLSTIATRMVRNLSKPESGNSPLVDTILRHEAGANETLDHAHQANPVSHALER
jgi:acyl transferase domain-containing protein/NADPH:quinone reductase-like Zn-dependent oxidoreductase/acyl carrier protein/NADP-dependent 3-hydroxy acid dehydrogenase YdfG/SAM-dependent methyltransferase